MAFIYRADCIFRTRTKTNTNTYKTLFERGGLCQPGPPLLIATENIWIFGWGYKCYPFLELYRRCLKSTSWQSSYTLPTMVHGKAIWNNMNWPNSLVPKQSSFLPTNRHLWMFYFDMNIRKRNKHMQSVNCYLWYTEDNDFHFIM